MVKRDVQRAAVRASTAACQMAAAAALTAAEKPRLHEARVGRASVLKTLSCQPPCPSIIRRNPCLTILYKK